MNAGGQVIALAEGLRTSKKMASEPLQDGVKPASKAPNTLAPKIVVKRPCRVEQKAKEQARYEFLKHKVPNIAISPTVVATTAGRYEAPQKGAVHTGTVADDTHRTTSSSASASPSNDPNMVAAAYDAHRITPSSTSASSSNRPNTGEIILTTAPEAPPYCHT